MHSKSFAALALFGTLAAAQTFTLCDPTKKKCPDDPALGGSVDIDYRKGKNSFFKEMDGTTLTYDKDLGAVFTIANEMQAPTVYSPDYIFFGKLEVELKVAPGAGIVTSIVLQSDTLDEIDWEWLGGHPNKVQTNYFSKGDTSTYDRGGDHDMDDSIGSFHTYTIDWTKDSLTWSIDGNVIRVLTYEEAKGGKIYPQSPMQVKLGSWVAGRSDAPEGTVQWAGGLANFKNGPSHAYYRRVAVTDYMGGEKAAKAYVYTDKTGTWESIFVDTEGEGLQDKEVDDDEEEAGKGKSKGKGKSGGDDEDEEESADSTGTVTPTASITPTPTPDQTDDEEAAETSDPSGASALQGATFAGAILSAVAIFANLI